MNWDWLGLLFRDYKINHGMQNEYNGQPDYFRDKSLDRISDDEFNHKHYVKVLKDVITKCETPINIGLYGRWGVGKSSILHMLQDEIKNGELSNRFKYVEVDAWGLSGNSLKQEVLVAINDKLRALSISRIENKLYGVEEETFLDIRTSWKTILYLFVVFGVSTGIGYWILSNQNLLDIENILKTLGISTVITAVASIVNFAIRPSKRIIPQKESSYHFSQIYQEMINKEVKKGRKLVVVIDNLDRCEDKLAVNLLGLIQTFMAKENCINILACDDEAIVNHLRRVKGESYIEREGNEFLSKFFQVTIRIPQFIPESLEMYVEGLMKRRSIPYNTNVKGILIAGAIKNPRKVNQFLNNLVALYRLAEFKEKGTQLRVGTLTEHPDFMAKIIIIRHEWPSFHKVLEKDPTMLNVQTQEYQNWLNKMNEDDEQQIDGLDDFLNATQHCEVDDVRPFIRLNQESFDAHLPDIDRFEINVRTNNTKLILDAINQADAERKTEYIKKMISINDKINKEKSLPNILNSTQALLTTLDVIKDENLVREALKNLGFHLCSGLMNGTLQKFDLNKIFDRLKHMENYYARKIYDDYRKLLKIDNVLNEPLIKKFLEKNVDIPIAVLNDVDEDFVKLLTENEEQMLNIVKQICGSTEWSSHKFTKPTKFILNLINMINFDESEIDNKRLEAYHTIIKDVTEVISFVERIKEIVVAAGNAASVLTPKCIAEIQNIDLDNADLKSVIASLFSALTTILMKNPDVEQKKIITEILIKFMMKLGVEYD